jgi:hypothetical protein
MIILTVGQCGNQIGFEVLNDLFSFLLTAKADKGSKQSTQESNEFFRYSVKAKCHIARAFAVDTEPKVIKSLQEKTFPSGKSQWRYSHTYFSQVFYIFSVDCFILVL